MALATHLLQLKHLRHLQKMGLLNNGQHVETKLPEVKIPVVQTPKSKQER